MHFCKNVKEIINFNIRPAIFFKHHEQWLGTEEMVFNIFQLCFMTLSTENILGLATFKIKSTLDQKKIKKVPSKMKQLSREVKLGHTDQRQKRREWHHCEL